VLARVVSVQRFGRGWHATASAWAVLSGAVDRRVFAFSNDSHVHCSGMMPPKPGRQVILYLRGSGREMRVVDASTYWWARRSGDPRLWRLNALLPLGAVREPTRDELRLIALTDPRVTLPRGETNLSHHTRIYTRAAAGWVVVTLVRSDSPRRLMTDTTEELPTEEICGCTLTSQTVDLDDLWNAGRLPPFEP
jgi:hypothetical protein